MTIKELTKILKQSRSLDIAESRLLALGYFKCENKDGFRNINLNDLYAGDEKDQAETKTVKTTTPLFWIDGEIIVNVPVKQDYEFVMLTQYEEHGKKWYKHGNLFPCNFRTYAKELK